MKKFYFLGLVLSLIFSCKKEISIGILKAPTESSSEPEIEVMDSIISVDGFDFPVGKPNGKGYYDAQNFGVNNHLGEDWNGNKGSNTDLGDTIYAIAHGYVSVAEDLEGGWGNVIRIVHQFPTGKEVESLYAHCDEILVKPQQKVERGQAIGTIGTANGQYVAHLHFEIRDVVGMPIGPGYSPIKDGYLHPTEFIKQNRPLENLEETEN
jgi:murein DD-endopeptidase MepM/ murein hydrolase activator NlpD